MDQLIIHHLFILCCSVLCSKTIKVNAGIVYISQSNIRKAKNCTVAKKNRNKSNRFLLLGFSCLSSVNWFWFLVFFFFCLAIVSTGYYDARQVFFPFIVISINAKLDCFDCFDCFFKGIMIQNFLLQYDGDYNIFFDFFQITFFLYINFLSNNP